jgi:SAM-dependent methyltransferase
MDIFTQANRETWNSVAKTHSESYYVGKLLAGELLLNDLIRSEVGCVRGKSLIHLLCHIGTDTLSWGLLGAQVTGVDISPEAIHYARQLALHSGIDASFITSDVMDLLDQTIGTYDIAFSSTGVLCWIPDIDRFAATVRKLLKPGGFFYLNDGHPFLNMLELDEQGLTTIKNDYFHRGAYEYDSFTDYSVQNLEIPGKSYEWDWTLGDIVTAFCQNGMRIAFLHEFPRFYYGGYPGFDVQIDKTEIHPCTFSLKAIAEG